MKFLYAMFLIVALLGFNSSTLFAETKETKIVDSQEEFRVLCDEKNNMTACVSMAQIYISTGDYKTALNYFEKACDGGNMLGCGAIGDLYQRALGVKKNYKKAVKFYTKSCYGGEMAGCGALGDLYMKGLGTDLSYAKAMELYTKACDGGKEMACDRLDDTFVGSLEDLTIRCNDAKEIDACTQLASEYGEGGDYVNAFKYTKKACDGGSMLGCAAEGYQYQKGIGVKKNIKKAIKLYNQSCDGGEIEVCLILGEMYENGIVVDLDYANALEIYTKACDGGDEKGCGNFVNLYEKECPVDATDPKKFCQKYK